MEKASVFIVFCMREWLGDPVKLEKLISKSGYQTFISCASFLIAHPYLSKYVNGILCPGRVSGAVVKNESLSSAFNFIRLNENIIFSKGHCIASEMQISFKSKLLLDKGSLRSRPFKIGDHLWVLSAKTIHNDNSIFSISLEYFSSTNHESIAMDNLKHIYNLIDKPETDSHDCTAEMTISDISSFARKSQRHMQKHKKLELIECDGLHVLSNCAIQSVVCFKLTQSPTNDSPGLIEVLPEDKVYTALALEDEHIELSLATLRSDTTTVTLRFVESPYMSHAMTKFMGWIVAGCKRPKTIDISDFNLASEREFLIILTLFKHLNHGQEQDAAMIFADYGKACIKQPRKSSLHTIHICQCYQRLTGLKSTRQWSGS